MKYMKQDLFLRLDLYRTDPAYYLITAGYDLSEVHYISDMNDLSVHYISLEMRLCLSLSI